jgi:hypothetical protein
MVPAKDEHGAAIGGAFGGTTTPSGGYRSMKNDPVDDAIDEILASADGDVRRALRAVLIENIQLETELRNLYAASEHGVRRDGKHSLH